VSRPLDLLPRQYDREGGAPRHARHLNRALVPFDDRYRDRQPEAAAIRGERRAVCAKLTIRIWKETASDDPSSRVAIVATPRMIARSAPRRWSAQRTAAYEKSFKVGTRPRLRSGILTWARCIGRATVKRGVTDMDQRTMLIGLVAGSEVLDGSVHSARLSRPRNASAPRNASSRESYRRLPWNSPLTSSCVSTPQSNCRRSQSIRPSSLQATTGARRVAAGVVAPVLPHSEARCRGQAQSSKDLVAEL
jgi:hypothetical protein